MNTYTWTIREKINETPNVQSLILEARGERPHFISGQYLTVRLPGFEPAEGKSYSISSSEDESFVRLTIKEMGTFSKALMTHTIGDTLTTSAPYGFFYPEYSEEHDLAFVAGGIGITPCLGIIKTLAAREYPKHIFLFYSNRTYADIIFEKELSILQRRFPKLTIFHHLTREKMSPAPHRYEHITGSVIMELIHDVSDTDFFVCGSIDFTKSLWGELRTAGVSSTQIYTEGYF